MVLIDPVLAEHVAGKRSFDRTGHVFRYRTVTGFNGRDDNGRLYWNYICICGNTGKATLYNLKRCGMCKTCAHYHAGRTRFGDGSRSYKKRFWLLLRHSASGRGLEVSITWEYLEQLLQNQDYKCALSGRPITLGRGSNTRGRDYQSGSASVDRIDSRRGYCEGNVQWVDKRVNMAKQRMTDKQFISMCKSVVDFRVQAVWEI